MSTPPEMRRVSPKSEQVLGTKVRRKAASLSWTTISSCTDRSSLPNTRLWQTGFRSAFSSTSSLFPVAGQHLLLPRVGTGAPRPQTSCAMPGNACSSVFRRATSCCQTVPQRQMIPNQSFLTPSLIGTWPRILEAYLISLPGRGPQTSPRTGWFYLLTQSHTSSSCQHSSAYDAARCVVLAFFSSS